MGLLCLEKGDVKEEQEGTSVMHNKDSMCALQSTFQTFSLLLVDSADGSHVFHIPRKSPTRQPGRPESRRRNETRAHHRWDATRAGASCSTAAASGLSRSGKR